ncbi:unnamed protein product, partial [Cuscuta europaea]
MRKNNREMGGNTRMRTTRASSRFNVLGDIDVEFPILNKEKPSVNLVNMNEFPPIHTSVQQGIDHKNRAASSATAVSPASQTSAATLDTSAVSPVISVPEKEVTNGTTSTPTVKDPPKAEQTVLSPKQLAENAQIEPSSGHQDGLRVAKAGGSAATGGFQADEVQPITEVGRLGQFTETLGKTRTAVNKTAATPGLTPSGEAGDRKGRKEPDIVAITANLEIPPKEKAWSSLFKDNRDPSNGLKLRYIPPKGKSLDFGDRIFPSMIEMWGFCLVGYITGKFPGLKAIYNLKNTWGVSCQIKTHAKGWIIFKFQNDGDREKVLNGGPYTIFGMQLLLKSLSEDFSFDDDEFLKVPIWVKFPNLHMKLWNEEVMSEVASMVGVPLSTDKVTQNRSNHHFARVLIEVDVSKPPRLSFPIRLPSRKVVNQMVVYETFPNFCFHCKMYGHHPFICKKLASKERDLAIVDKKEDTVNEVSQVEIVEIAVPAAQPAAQEPPDVAAHPTGCCSDPTGSTGQSLSQGPASANLGASLH